MSTLRIGLLFIAMFCTCTAWAADRRPSMNRVRLFEADTCSRCAINDNLFRNAISASCEFIDLHHEELSFGECR